MANFSGTSGNDNLTGTSGNDTFNMSQGGDDTVQGLAGRDLFVYGAAFTAADSVDGGAGNDVLRLDGDYSAGVVFTASTMTSVESLQLDAGHSYNLTLVDANVAPGSTTIVQAGTLTATDVLTLDLSAVESGGFDITAGAGQDVLGGSQNADTFDLSQGGNDIASGNGGDDVFVMGAAFTGHDRIDGGTGNDIVMLDGDYSKPVTFAGYTMKNVETLDLAGGHSYNLTIADATIARGQSLAVDGSALGAGDTLTFNGGADTNGQLRITAGAGNDVITGGSNDSAGDIIDFSEGGHDTFHASNGSYTVDMGAALDPLDTLTVGGRGVVVLDGGYSGANAITLTATTVTGAGLILEGGHDYHITTSSVSLEIDSQANAGDTVFVDESAIRTENSFTGGHGNETYIGGSSKDFFNDDGGNETFTGNGGNDIFNMGLNFNAADNIDGGAGSDTVNISGLNAGPLVMTATTMTNVEDLVASGMSEPFSITSNDATVAAGQTLTVDARNMESNFTFDGSAETDGHFVFLNAGGAGALVDTFIGGALSDTINMGHRTNGFATGGGGADTIIAGAIGRHNFDTLIYNAVSDSTSVNYDSVTGWNFTGDIFHVSPVTTVTGVDAAVTTGALSTATFDGDLAGDVGAGQLAAHHAMLFTPDSGTLSGHTFLVIDANGVAGYQASADLVIDVTGATGTLATSSFT